MDPNQEKKPSEYTVAELKEEGGKLRKEWVDVGTTADWLRGRERNQVLVLALLLRHEHLVGKNRPRELITLLVPELCRRIEFIGEKYRELSQEEREARDALERSRAEEDRLRLYENRAQELLAENDRLRLQMVSSGVEQVNEAQRLREKARTYDLIKELADRDPEVEGLTVWAAVNRWHNRAEEADTDAADLRALAEHLGVDADRTLDDMLVELEQKAVYAPLLEHTGLQREVERVQYEIRDLKRRLCDEAGINWDRAAMWSNEKLAREVTDLLLKRARTRAQDENKDVLAVAQRENERLRAELDRIAKEFERVVPERVRGSRFRNHAVWAGHIVDRLVLKEHEAKKEAEGADDRTWGSGRHRPSHWAQKNPGQADHYWGLLRAVGDALGINIEDEHLAPCDLTELMDRILGSGDSAELANLLEEWKRDRDREAQDYGTTGDRDQAPRGLVIAEDPRTARWQTDLEQISRLLEHYEAEARPRDQTELEGVVERVTTVIQTLDGKLNLAQGEHESIHQVLDRYMGGRALRQPGEALRDRVARCLATMDQNIDYARGEMTRARAQYGEAQRKAIGLESRAKSAEAARDQAYQELAAIRNALIDAGLEFPTESNTKAIERIAGEREGSERSREAVGYLSQISEHLAEYEPATGPVPAAELGDRGVVHRVRKVIDKLASDRAQYRSELQEAHRVLDQHLGQPVSLVTRNLSYRTDQALSAFASQRDRFKKEKQSLLDEVKIVQRHLEPYDIPTGIPFSERVRLLGARYEGLVKEHDRLLEAWQSCLESQHAGTDAIRLICERAVELYEAKQPVSLEERIRIQNEGGVFTSATWANALRELSGAKQTLDGKVVRSLLRGRPDIGPEGSSDAYFRLRPR